MKQVKDYLQDQRPSSPQSGENSPEWADLPQLTVTDVKARIVTLAMLESVSPSLDAAVDTCKDWIMARKEGKIVSMVLSGPPGVGKTHMAASCAWYIHLASGGMPIAPEGTILKWPDLIQKLDGQVNMGNLLPSRRKRPPDWKPVKQWVIVLDDLGRHDNFPYVGVSGQDAERQARCFRMIDHVYSAGIPIIITTNLDLKALAEYVGPASWDRLVSMCPKGFMREISAPSYRVKGSGR